MENLDARNCDIFQISSSDEREFLEENHLQGYARSYLCYGLFHKDELVSLMSFGKPRFSRHHQWEIIRDCTKRNYNIRGGVSRLWKYFIENNIVSSCICYSYPHNGEFTSKYVDYCGFKNVKRSKPEKKIYFEGIWKGSHKRIDKPILERHGVDRLLKGSFGHDCTNEEILLSLGFEEKYEDGYSPQVDSYFPNGILYKITDLDTGKFYIGETIRVDDFNNGLYNGSGSKWVDYYEKYKDLHNFKREILRDSFRTPKELYDAEVREIRKYCIKLDNGSYKVDDSTGCMNVKTCIQADMPICPECNAILFHHKKTCSMYKEPTQCSECGLTYGHHEKTCSKYAPKRTCSECGSVGSHKKGCSKYKELIKCLECGGSGTHYKTCSHYTSPSPCPECGLTYGHHKINCSKIELCPECGGKKGRHRLNCSKYKELKSCPECGFKGGKHKSNCSKYSSDKTCPECGGVSGNHRSSCSKKKKIEICQECGSPIKSHKKTCSKYKARVCPECGRTFAHDPSCSFYNSKLTCQECGVSQGNHKKTCSYYTKPEPCPECGSTTRHKKGCSKYKPMRTCEECGNPVNSHKNTCSKFKPRVCSECGGRSGQHKLGCSKYKAKGTCSECGGHNGAHKKTCSNYTPMKPCPECGGIDGKHRKNCSKYKSPDNRCEFCGTPPGGKHKKECPNFKPIICSECGGRSGRHKPGCSKHKELKKCEFCGSSTRHKKNCPNNKQPNKQDIFHQS